MKAQFFPYKDENPSRSFPIVMILLIIVNFVIFAWSLTDFDNIISTYGFTPIYFSFFTILTSMFLHGGIGHIAGNMWYLWLFGDNVEDRFGKIKFLIFYICAGFFAAFVHYISDPFSEIPAIGASGAISGVLGAYMAIFPSVRVKTIGPFYQIFEIPAWALIGFWFVLQLFSGIFTIIGGLGGGGIAFWAHIGGFIFGWMTGKIYNKRLWEFLLTK